MIPFEDKDEWDIRFHLVIPGWIVRLMLIILAIGILMLANAVIGAI